MFCMSHFSQTHFNIPSTKYAESVKCESFLLANCPYNTFSPLSQNISHKTIKCS